MQLDSGVQYPHEVLSQRNFKRQIQVSQPTRQLTIDLAVSANLATPTDLAVSGTGIYDCVAQMTGNPLADCTTISLQSIRGVLTIPNIITGLNDKFQFTVTGTGYIGTLLQGSYDINLFSTSLAGSIAAASGVGCGVVNLDTARGTFGLRVAAGNVLSFTTAGSMQRYPRFCSWPLGAPAVEQTITGAWLFFTRFVGIQMPELTRLIPMPMLGNMSRFSQFLTMIPIANPVQPVFVLQSYDHHDIVVPMRYDDRISSMGVQLYDEFGNLMSRYCTQVSDWLTLTFAVTR